MSPLYLDSEVYANYTLFMFMNDDEQVAAFEQFDGKPLDVERVKTLLAKDYELTTFNGNYYDLPIMKLALAGASCEEIKVASDDIIVNGVKPWDFERQYPQANINLNHVDLIEVAPGKASLKLYGARLHAPRLQDLPIDPSALIQPEQRALLRHYCRNDLRLTKTLRTALAEQLELRRTMGQVLADELFNARLAGIMTPPDLRSKSDAQIAESVLKQRLFIRTGVIPRKQDGGLKKFKYTPPSYIRFRHPTLLQALQLVSEAEYVVKPDTGHVIMPPAIEKLAITIGSTTYKMGLGGIHSQEATVKYEADDERFLRDIDVVSYYPNLILNMGMYPDSTGPAFIDEYRSIKDERVTAKRAGQKVKSDTLKITLNGTFGKTSNRYSILYNPKLMIATTLTGQLSLLMLAEAFERYGIPVVSANTDGLVIHCHRHQEERQRTIVKVWEKCTGLETEETDYSALYSRDVNSYVAIKTDGGIKTKGFFASAGLSKNPQNEICREAVVALLTNNESVEHTIRECRNLSKFLSVRTVTGGAVKDGVHLGRAIRWYYSTAVSGTIEYASNGNKVPRTVGARPLMDLPEEFPDDIDFDWYIKEANELLMDLAVIPRPPKPTLPRRNTKEWKSLLEQGLVEVDDYDKPQWAVHWELVPEKYRNY